MTKNNTFRNFKLFHLVKVLIKYFKVAEKILSSRRSKKTFSSIFVLSGSILFLVAVVVALFLLTGKVFVELFGWLVFPFPKRMFKSKKDRPKTS